MHNEMSKSHIFLQNNPKKEYYLILLMAQTYLQNLNQRMPERKIGQQSQTYDTKQSESKINHEG